MTDRKVTFVQMARMGKLFPSDTLTINLMSEGQTKEFIKIGPYKHGLSEEELQKTVEVAMRLEGFEVWWVNN